MIRTIVSVSLVLAGLSVVAVPSNAEERDQKQCLLYGRSCAGIINTLPERISALKAELTKGPLKYSSEELNLLQARLTEAERSAKSLNKAGK